jgi:hypothetical protein
MGTLFCLSSFGDRFPRQVPDPHGEVPIYEPGGCARVRPWARIHNKEEQITFLQATILARGKRERKRKRVSPSFPLRNSACAELNVTAAGGGGGGSGGSGFPNEALRRNTQINPQSSVYVHLLVYTPLPKALREPPKVAGSTKRLLGWGIQNVEEEEGSRLLLFGRWRSFLQISSSGDETKENQNKSRTRK